MLETTAVNSGVGSVYLQYDFKNVDECIKEANDKETVRYSGKRFENNR